MTNPIERTVQWFQTAKQMDNPLQPSVRRSAFYLGMQLEELSEKLEAVTGPTPATVWLSSLGNEFKSGFFDPEVAAAFLDPAAVEKMLDADLDLIWVSVGAAAAQGADAPGGYNEVGNRNDAKFVDGVAQLDPVTGKVLKPEGWTPPNLRPFLHPSFQTPTQENAE